jgi:hypothetical protein
MLARSKWRLVKLMIGAFLIYLAVDYFYFGRETDVSNENEVRPWIHREFELQQEAYLYRLRGGKRTYVDIPANDSTLRESISVFNERPEQFPLIHGTHDWIRPLAAGTRFRIVRAYLFARPAVGPHFHIEAEILPVSRQNPKVHLNRFFYTQTYPPAILRPISTRLEQIN